MNERKTDAEIDKEIEKGEKFVAEHPRSFFGTDNTKQFRIFKKIMTKVKEGQSYNTIDAWIADVYGDEEDMEEYTFANDCLLWAFNELGAGEDIW